MYDAKCSRQGLLEKFSGALSRFLAEKGSLGEPSG
jgi:hypothetical protein